MTILITSAAGRTSRHVSTSLLSTSPSTPVRLLLHSSSSIRSLKSSFPSLTDSSFVVADYLEYSSLPPAMEGVDVVFYNGSGFHPQETAMGVNVINAAVEAGVKHFVFCSVLYPFLSKLIHHTAKLGIEEYLTESGLNFTILQPTSFMQNIPLTQLLSTPTTSPIILPCTYEPTTLQGFVSLTDLGAVAASILLSPAQHAYATYQLVGENRTLQSLAALLAEQTEREVRCEKVGKKAFSELVARRGQGMSTEAMNDYALDLLERMLFYYDKRGIPGSANVLKWLLGREPTTWRDLVNAELKYSHA